MNKTIKLKGLSRRGKTRISEHGDIFNLIEKKANDGGQLDLILVESINNTWRGEKWLGWFIVGKEVDIVE